MKKLIILFAIIATAFSCSNDENAKTKSNVDIINTSTTFKAFGISTTELDMNNIQSETTPAGQNFLLVSFADKTVPKKIVNHVDQSGEIDFSSLVEFESSITMNNYARSVQ